MGNDFDEFAADYDQAINQGLRFTGESRQFFAEQRMRWLARRLGSMGLAPRRALDFGCGTGGSLPFFFQHLAVQSVLALDISAASIEEAKRQCANLNIEFRLNSDFVPSGDVDLAFCNGVFHHIPPPARSATMVCIGRALRPGGVFAFWENNPGNPMTRWMMSRIPFDRDAVMVWPREARRLLREAGFTVLRTDFAFVFPACLGFLRPCERFLSPLPIGGQYLVLAQKIPPIGHRQPSQAPAATTGADPHVADAKPESGRSHGHGT